MKNVASYPGFFPGCHKKLASFSYAMPSLETDEEARVATKKTQMRLYKLGFKLTPFSKKVQIKGNI